MMNRINIPKWLEPKRNGGYRVNIASLGRTILQNHPYIYNKKLYMSDSAIYMNDGWHAHHAEDYVKWLVAQALNSVDDLCNVPVTNYRDVRYYIHSAGWRLITRDPFFNQPTQDLISFRNGTLNLKTGKFGPNRATYYLLQRVPWNYRLEAKSDTNLETFQWVKALLDNDETAALTLCKFIGNALTCNYDKNHFIVLRGDPHYESGKTRLLCYLRSLLTEKDARITNVHDLRCWRKYNDFAFGTHLVMADDSELLQDRITSRLIRQVVNHEPMDMRLKFHHGVVNQPYASLIWATSTKPRLWGDNKYLKSRMIEFPMTANLDNRYVKRTFNERFPRTLLESQREEFINLCVHLAQRKPAYV